MFEEGAKIVYPMYGAGVIENIESDVINGTEEKHYIIRIPNGNLKIKVGASKADKIGLRPVSTEEEITDAFKKAVSSNSSIQSNWNIRYKENLEKIRTGRISEVAEVARSLCLRERQRGLSGAEKKMFNNAKQIVLSEVVFSKKLEKDKAEEYLAKELFY
ncbi:CarD family transcriptional regulator [Lachnospiraceae bacterium NSJ-143]|nr:CarD family transcriptional regulator [Lachnospiraceae bacterium NSJ-143]